MSSASPMAAPPTDRVADRGADRRRAGPHAARPGRLPAERVHRRFFAGTYLRTTRAVGDGRRPGVLRGPGLGAAVGRGLRRALSGRARRRPRRRPRPPRPWRLAFDAPADLPPLRHVLLGINAHINYDLPQALLAVISDDEFTDPVLMARRRRDHERIDAVLAARVGRGGRRARRPQRARPAARAVEPSGQPSGSCARRGRRSGTTPSSCRRARLAGADAYRAAAGRAGGAQSAAKIADLLAPGQVLLRLAVAGFGVVLPPL